MLFLARSKRLLRPNNWTNLKIIARNIGPVCGPPSCPMTTAQKVLIGGGSMLLMMVIPIFGILSLPSWARKHKNLGKARKEETLGEVPPN